MTLSEVGSEPVVEPVELDALICPGCGDPVAGEPPLGWPAQAGERPGFSHRDGSVLCADEAGRFGEPVETGRLRYGLTAAGADALAGDARDDRGPVGGVVVSPRAGQVVTFTAGPLGLVKTVGDTRFRPESVEAGDTGVYVAPHPTLADHGWHLVRVRELLCPCHASQFSTGGVS